MMRYVAPMERQLRHIAARIPKRSTPNSMTSHDLDESTGQRLAEHTASMLGSWGFIGGQACVMAIWILINTLAFTGAIHFDSFPFVFLNLTMSAEAAFTGPILLIAANVGSMRDHKQFDRMESIERKLEELLEQGKRTRGGKSMLGKYDRGLVGSEVTVDEAADDLETKGGKPSKGTPADGRLKDNGPAKKPASDDDETKPGKKPAFPGAAPPFKSGGKGK